MWRHGHSGKMATWMKMETRTRLPQVKNCLGPLPKTGRGKVRSSCRTIGEYMTLPKTWFQTFSLHNEDNTFVLFLATQFAAPCYSCPRKLIQKDTWILKVLSLWSEELLLNHHILHRLSRLLSVGWTRASQTLLCIVFTCNSFINTAVWLPPPEMLV